MKRFAFFWAILMTVMVFNGCGGKEKVPDKIGLDYKVFSSQSLDCEYDHNLLYRNDLTIKGADPTVIRVKDKRHPDYGKFYMYATSDDLGGQGFLCWKSDNLNDWEKVGVAYKPNIKSWGKTALWAPCVVYRQEDNGGQGRYYMYYCAMNYNYKWTEHPAHRNGYMTIGLAVANKPEGPFVQWTGKNADGEDVTIEDPIVNPLNFAKEPASDRYAGVDANVDGNLYNKSLIDPNIFFNKGKIYLYVNCYGIWGMEMKDMFTPDYKTAIQLTRRDKLAMDEASGQSQFECGVNEGAYMMEHNGKYYLTYSVASFAGKDYSVKQAIGDSPLGPFEKVTLEDGGMVLSAMDYANGGVNYDFMSGTGHHTIVEVDNEPYIVYHAHQDRERTDGSKPSFRYIAMDKIYFIRNIKGQEIMYVNGPTWSLQPLPSWISGCNNLMLDANITATNLYGNSSPEYMRDGVFKNHKNNFVYPSCFKKSTEIKIKFKKLCEIKGIMIYPSFENEMWFKNIKSIDFKGVIAGITGEWNVNNIPFDTISYFDSKKNTVRPGGSYLVTFNNLKSDEITIEIDSEKPFAVDEIVVLGK